MSDLIEHAIRELDLCGQAEEDPGYAACLVAAVAAFASWGHSGESAQVARQQLALLLDWQTLSPLTDNPEEWEDRSEMSGYPIWQNVRNSRAMSEDGGCTYWLVEPEQLDENGHRVMHQAGVHVWPAPAVPACCAGTGMADYAAVPCPDPECPVPTAG